MASRTAKKAARTPKLPLEFHDPHTGDLIGVLNVENGELVFEGKLNNSAVAFFQSFFKPLVDAYIMEELSTGVIAEVRDATPLTPFVNDEYPEPDEGEDDG
jgi:hypothetical protein